MLKLVVGLVVLLPLLAGEARAQENPPPSEKPAGGQQAAVERAVQRWQVGVQGGIGLDPELIDVAIHGHIGPFFSPNIAFRPSLELGFGEITTLFAINLDVLYTFPGTRPGVNTDSLLIPYIGAGPSFGLSHRDIESDVEVENITGKTRSRFDFGDTDFNAGMNFIVGVKKQNGAFFEMKATAWGVSNVRLILGFNF